MNPIHHMCNRLSQWSVVILLLTILGTSGCSRAFWRQQADQDAYEAISQRMTDPRWQLPRFNLMPDPDSRFFDPHDPDSPPLPPDDPAAHTYMHCVDGMSGYKSWHKLGDSFIIENPHWLAKYGVTPEMLNTETGDYTGRLPKFENLTLAQSVELSQIHSRELQTQIENLYINAINLSEERFRFAIQYTNPTLSWGHRLFPFSSVHRDGTKVIDDNPDSTSLNTAFGFRKLLPAGGQIAADIANQAVWTFSSHSGGMTVRAPTTLSFALTQPLLQGAGRKIVLENLTQAERSLLYQTRSLARFRQSLFTNVVSDGSGNYLNLLQQIQVIRNQQQNIERLQTQVQILESNASQKYSRVRTELAAMPEGVEIPVSLKDKLLFNGGFLLWLDNVMSAEEEKALLELSRNPAIPADNGLPLAIQEIIQAIRVTPSPLDVLQLRGQLANSINQLRSQERQLQDALDSFKLTLGLPTDTTLSIDDRWLKPFTMIDPKLKEIEQGVMDFLSICSSLPYDDPSTEELLAANRALQPVIERIEKEGFALLESDAGGLNAKIEARLASLETQEERDRVELDIQRDLRLLNDAKARLNNLKLKVQELDQLIQAPEAQKPVRKEGDPPPEKKFDELGEEIKPVDQQLREDYRMEINLAHANLLQVTRSLTVVEIGLRVEQITVPQFDMPLDVVMQTAVENRLDLMNSKAQVMDARRRLEVAANALRSALGLSVKATTRSFDSQPLNFPSENFEIQSGLEFKGPLNKIAERNDYRVALVSYQQARRAYMLAEDNVKLDVRRNWRQLSVLKRNLETSRLQLRLAAKQYESAVDQASAPAQTTGGGGGSTGGVQGNNLIQALNAIITAQNSLIQNWVSFEQNRLGIYRDMGMMEIGPDGIWNDPQYRGMLDQENQDGSPNPQTLPDGGLNDGKPEAIPTPADLDGLGDLDDRRGRDGRGGQAEGVVLSLDGKSAKRLLPVQYEESGEEAVLDLFAGPGESGQPGERNAE